MSSNLQETVPDGVRVVDDRLIKVTEAASRKLQSLRQREESGARYLRVKVTGGGCSGLSYKLAFVESPKSGDLYIPGEVGLLIDTKSALYLKGMTMDYSDKLVAGGFKFNNPNAKASCSCGESFAV